MPAVNRKDNQELSGSYSYVKECSNVTLKLDKKITNKVWSIEFGDIQKKLNELPKGIKNINIDLSSATWVDPMPMMSLLLTLFQVKNTNPNVNIRFLILCKTAGNNAPDGVVAKFLLKNGFFDYALTKDGCKLVNSKSDEDIINDLKDSKSQIDDTETILGDSHVLDLHIVDFKNKNISEYIEKILNTKVKPNLETKVPTHRFKETISRLDSVFEEFLHNINEHAYPKDSKTKFGAIYIRYRVGGLNNKFSGQTSLYDFFKKSEEESAYLNEPFVHSVSDFLEIFILDNGQGIERSYFTDEEIKKDLEFV